MGFVSFIGRRSEVVENFVGMGYLQRRGNITKQPASPPLACYKNVCLLRYHTFSKAV